MDDSRSLTVWVLLLRASGASLQSLPVAQVLPIVSGGLGSQGHLRDSTPVSLPDRGQAKVVHPYGSVVSIESTAPVTLAGSVSRRYSASTHGRAESCAVVIMFHTGADKPPGGTWEFPARCTNILLARAIAQICDPRGLGQVPWTASSPSRSTGRCSLFQTSIPSIVPSPERLAPSQVPKPSAVCRPGGVLAFNREACRYHRPRW